jgi:hypothetical protein
MTKPSQKKLCIISDRVTVSDKQVEEKNGCDLQHSLHDKAENDTTPMNLPAKPLTQKLGVCGHLQKYNVLKYC